MDNLLIHIIFTEPNTNNKILHKEIINGIPQENTLFRKPLGWKQSIHIFYDIDGTIEKIDDTKWWILLLNGVEHNETMGSITNGKFIIEGTQQELDSKVLLVKFQTTSKLTLSKDVILEYNTQFHFAKPENCENQ